MLRQYRPLARHVTAIVFLPTGLYYEIRSNRKLKIGRGHVDVVVVVGGDDDGVDKNFANFRLEINIFDRWFGAKMSSSREQLTFDKTTKKPQIKVAQGSKSASKLI